MNEVRVQRVADALQLATELQASGRPHVFRGQRRNWRVTSSFARLGQHLHEEALQKLARYEHWIATTPGLESLAGNADAAIAVAQHYGFPTTFVDFTTDPRIAAFFASDGSADGDESEDACIICVDVTDFTDFWTAMPTKYPRPELLSLDVPNLWRLEAQLGLFLHCPYADIEMFYDFDRILFPASSRYTEMLRSSVYPARKSGLEIVLDQFFMNERMLEFEKSYTRPVGSAVVLVEGDEQGYDPDVFPEGLPDHPSWAAEALRPWLELRTERFRGAQTSLTIPILLDPRGGLNPMIHRIATEVYARLEESHDMRSKLISWNVTVVDGYDMPSSFSDSFAPKLMRLWDGLRSLPHRDIDIALAIATCAAFAVSLRGDFRNPDGRHWREGVEQCLAQPVEIEFGTTDGSYSRGYATAQAVAEAVRADFLSFVADEWKSSLASNPRGVLQTAWTPRKTFVFSTLNQLIAQQVAPFQVLARSEAVFYTAARLNVLGLP